MFVAVARVTLSIPEAGSLKGKRQVVRKVIDRVQARFSVAIAEVGEHDLWQKAVLGIAVVANEHTFAQETVDKVLHFIEEMYVAPVVSRDTEVIAMGGDFYGREAGSGGLNGPHFDLSSALNSGHRTLAEAEAEADGAREPEHPAPRRGHRPGKSGRQPMSEEERTRAIEDLRRRMKSSRLHGGDGDDE